ncbi:MAG: hypothetical protein J7500_10710 [Sphingomonas sp.]|uniref:hypothetical protein n=1 Tax=Sphingomonas sp. TaxID=28214 RepID=UPI001B0D1B46|nr:hypothetical protein [Sphingomonas sp.]MBO9623170.1 hypothetical protein [Sphingomonas sp.]
MKRSVLVLAGGLTVLLAAPTPAEAQRNGQRGEAELARTVAGRTAGRPVNCIRLSAIRSSRIISRTAIVYDTGRTLFVNRPRSGASSLDSDSVLVTRTTGSQLCRLDTVRLVDRGTRFQRGFVILDRFVPYTRPRR